jgi:hypothetical protein
VREANGRSLDTTGDFQTPRDLASAVWRSLDGPEVDVLVEPTVGLGVFLSTVPATHSHLPWLVYDLNPSYVAYTEELALTSGLTAEARCKSIFDVGHAELQADIEGKRVLAIGNPPWVTNSAQGGAATTNLPRKLNRFGLRGFDAMTGKANFDIAEAALLATIEALASASEVRLAFLIKRSVAIKMAKDILGTPGIVSAKFSRIDAMKWFGVAVEAGLFDVTVRPASRETTHRLRLAPALGKPVATEAGLVDGMFVSDVALYMQSRTVEAAAGGGFAWRQGIKHDLAKVLELKRTPDGLINGFGESVEIELDVLCPLFKSSDLAAGRPASRFLPLYQHDLTGPLDNLSERWPALAIYLDRYRDLFAARGSGIYKGKPDFMLFGVGEYSRAPFKVAVSGFYKEPHFSVLTPGDGGQPPLVDDTCYMLPFEHLDDAERIADYLNSEAVRGFLSSIADATAKRPFTKGILGRISAPLDTALVMA